MRDILGSYKWAEYRCNKLNSPDLRAINWMLSFSLINVRAGKGVFDKEGKTDGRMNVSYLFCCTEMYCQFSVRANIEFVYLCAVLTSLVSASDCAITKKHWHFAIWGSWTVHTCSTILGMSPQKASQIPLVQWDLVLGVFRAAALGYSKPIDFSPCLHILIHIPLELLLFLFKMHFWPQGVTARFNRIP